MKVEDNIFAMDLEPACKNDSNTNEIVNGDNINNNEKEKEEEKDNNEDNVYDDMAAEEERKVKQVNNESDFVTVTRHSR